MRNILLTIAFDGTNYHGWQVQKNALTVQEVLQKAIHKVVGSTVDVKGVSRTDSGVHANMFCVSFKTYSEIETERLLCALNMYLPRDIAVKECKEVEPDFHARYSAVAKQYVYKIWNSPIRNPFLDRYSLHYWYPLDVEKLNGAAKGFLGTHDFTSFCSIRTDTEDMVRTVRRSEVVRQGDMVEFIVEADGFLFNMVRIMVGTLLFVAQGKIAEDGILDIILSKDRKKAGPTAPAHGLFLNKVYYE